jgi:hypothetical protein
MVDSCDRPHVSPPVAATSGRKKRLISDANQSQLPVLGRRDMMGSGSSMMLGAGLTWLLVFIVLVLCIGARIKYRRN